MLPVAQESQAELDPVDPQENRVAQVSQARMVSQDHLVQSENLEDQGNPVGRVETDRLGKTASVGVADPATLDRKDLRDAQEITVIKDDRARMEHQARWVHPVVPVGRVTQVWTVNAVALEEWECRALTQLTAHALSGLPATLRLEDIEGIRLRNTF